MRRLLPLFACGLAACGAPTTPEGYPDVKGTYAGSLSTQFTAEPGGARTSGGPCPVTLSITTQSRGSFSGTLDRGLPCVRAMQPVGGAVDRDGGLQLGLEAAGAYQGYDQCRYVSGDQWWRGSLRGDELALTIDVLLECEGAGRLATRGAISARRAPGSR